MCEQASKDYSIINCYKMEFPKCRFVGIKYKNSDRVDGMYGYHWGQWFQTGKFENLEKLITDEYKAAHPDFGAAIGLMKDKGCGDADYFEYWIGMFLPENCEVPEGFEYIDFDYKNAGICWIKGKEQFVFCHEAECYKELEKNGMNGIVADDGGYYFFEWYCCPRFTSPDENGEVILDIGFFVE